MTPEWSVSAKGWSPEKITHHGNLFLLGNGRMGCRGTLEEFGPDEKVGVLLPGVYDRVGDSWREPVNAPNGFFVRISVNGRALNPLTFPPVDHFQSLDMRRALHTRKSVFVDGETRAELRAERFLSAADVDLMAMRLELHVSGPAEIVVETGIDARIWDLNGPHLEDLTARVHDDVVVLTGRTHEAGHRVAVAEAASASSSRPSDNSNIAGSLRRWHFPHGDGLEFSLTKVVAVATSLDGSGDPAVRASAKAAEATGLGYEALREAHCTVWADRWERADMRIAGDPESLHALRYSLYQLLSAAPFHSEYLSIPARALSGQVYKGAVFWDTEIFMLPFFLAVFPEVARNLVRYRIHTLPGARAKAREYGFEGAFYPWEGQEGGHEACTLFNVTDVFTGRPMRTYFRDKQIHISGDVAWAVRAYVDATGDTGLLADGGWEVLLECARFFFSYAFRRTTSDEYVLNDVTGPDEYHERVANNAYTNRLARHAVESCLQAAGQLRSTDTEGFSALAAHLGFTAEEEGRLAAFAAGLRMPAPDPGTGVIEQFDGYFDLEDCSLAELKARVLDPTEYLGGGCGLATTTRIIKQADVVLMLHLFAGDFSEAIRAANWNFYEPRTEHGSSLSACAYALVAATTGKSDFAFRYFRKTATVDLTGDSKQYVGPLYIGGTHPAANGGAWMVAALGFAGLRFSHDALEISPRLPPGWNSVAFHVTYRGCELRLSLAPEGGCLNVQSCPENSAAHALVSGVRHPIVPDLILNFNTINP